MAFMEEAYCSQCGKQFIAMHPSYSCRNYTCSDCHEKKEKEEYNKYREERNSHTVEERIKYIEDWMYYRKKRNT